MTTKNILISGGSSGIGFSIAKSLIKQKHNVGIISRGNPNQWPKKIPGSWNQQKNYIKTDLKKFKSKNLRHWLKQNKSLNALILCANYYGIGLRHSLTNTTLKEWMDIFQINLHSQFRLIELCLPYLLQQPNSLILAITSDVTYKSGEGRIAYAVSKSASHKLLNSLAKELAGSNVSTVELLPANTVDTPGIRKRRPKNFNYSNYQSPDSFIKPTLDLINLPNEKLNGKCIKVYNTQIRIFDPTTKLK